MTTTDARLVLVTRSEPGATDLVNALIAAGYAAASCPVLEIRRIDDAAARRVLARLDGFDVAIFVSAHAVHCAFESIDRGALPSHPIWIAVGASTAAALARHGVEARVPAVESSEGILALPQLSDVRGRRILVCAGEGGRDIIAGTLAQRGAHVETVVQYRREAVSVERLRTRVAEPRSIGAVIVSSAEGGVAFAALWRSISGSPAVPIVVPSQRVAVALAGLGFDRVAVSDGAGAKAVLATLEHMRDSDE
ncbi:MAG TPA: uroporphyrinogen-III synthase [Pseudomonadales bacterium]|nr:uroporphyrinogen-III synthase [Pseudomonadales bacterium]